MRIFICFHPSMHPIIHPPTHSSIPPFHPSLSIFNTYGCSGVICLRVASAFSVSPRSSDKSTLVIWILKERKKKMLLNWFWLETLLVCQWIQESHLSHPPPYTHTHTLSRVFRGPWVLNYYPCPIKLLFQSLIILPDFFRGSMKLVQSILHKLRCLVLLI